MSQAHYDQRLRLSRCRNCVLAKTLVTTLWCSQQTAKSELRALYRSRWYIELDLRNFRC